MNFSSTNFMGFPDSGNSMAGLTAGIIEVFLQQNLINKDVCSPKASEIEATVLTWLRELIGYQNKRVIKDVGDIGGVVTTGGVMSNVYALMAARKKYPEKSIIILPDNIGHYSLAFAADWLNLGVKIVFCKTVAYKMSLHNLDKLLEMYGDDVLFVGVYACDSMTSTCDDLTGIYQLVEKHNLKLWLHCDACDGFVLRFTEKYSSKLECLKYYDSCTMDPHKVLWLPYTMSVVLFKNPSDGIRISRTSEIIMDNALSFGKMTPFIGSKEYSSLKLWMVMKTLGKAKIEQMVLKRIDNTNKFKNLLEGTTTLKVMNDDVLFLVIFQYIPYLDMKVEQINQLNKRLYRQIVMEGKYYFHGFSIRVNGVNRFVLRYNSGNLNLNENDLYKSVQYISKLSRVVNYYDN